MLFTAQKEKFLVLHNTHSSVLGDVLESDAETGLNEAGEGLVAPRESQRMVRGFLISPHICGERFHGLERQGALWDCWGLVGKRSWLLLQLWS